MGGRGRGRSGVASCRLGRAGGAPVSRPHMTLKVMSARKARTPQRMGAAKSTAQKKLLSVGWMNRCSCDHERDTHTHTGRHAAWRRGHGLGHGGRGAAAACLEALESPVVLPSLVHIIPPPQPDEQPP